MGSFWNNPLYLFYPYGRLKRVDTWLTRALFRDPDPRGAEAGEFGGQFSEIDLHLHGVLSDHVRVGFPPRSFQIATRSMGKPLLNSRKRHLLSLTDP